MKTEFTLLYITFPSHKSALDLAHKCLKAKLIACANIIPKSISIYQWQDKAEQQQETIAIFRTIKTKQEELKELIIKNHEYDCPCIGLIDIDFLNQDFSQWIIENID